MVLALGVAHSAQAAAAQREVTDMTNETAEKECGYIEDGDVETGKRI